MAIKHVIGHNPDLRHHKRSFLGNPILKYNFLGIKQSILKFKQLP